MGPNAPIGQLAACRGPRRAARRKRGRCGPARLAVRKPRLGTCTWPAAAPAAPPRQYCSSSCFAEGDMIRPNRGECSALLDAVALLVRGLRWSARLLASQALRVRTASEHGSMQHKTICAWGHAQSLMLVQCCCTRQRVKRDHFQLA
jgi:hypothetical protein